MWLKVLLIGFLLTASLISKDGIAIIENKIVPQINEQILSETENAYNPIPSPDGKMIAYVETGWDRNFPISGMGRSNLKSNIKLMDKEGNVLSKTRLADAFLYGWTSDSKKLIAYRDWQYGLLPIDAINHKLELFEANLFGDKPSPNSKKTNKNIMTMGTIPLNIEFSERIAFLEKENLFLWVKNELKSERDKKEPFNYHSTWISSTIKTPQGKNFLSFKDWIDSDNIFVVSPNERYIAMFGAGRGENKLQIYDRENKLWTQLGKIIIHPDESWDYIKPSWNPWFADSSKLVFVSDEGIVLSSPDGKIKKVIIKEKENVGIPTSSPDGKMIAYATFDPRPMKERSDLKFYGGTTIWVKKLEDESEAIPVTNNSDDETYCLRWLNNQEIVFDRVADEVFFKKARIWKAKIQN